MTSRGGAGGVSTGGRGAQAAMASKRRTKRAERRAKGCASDPNTAISVAGRLTKCFDIRDDHLVLVGQGDQGLLAHRGEGPAHGLDGQSEEIRDIAGRKKRRQDTPMPIKGLVPGMAVHFARCCHPLPGDRIVGIVTTGKGVTIHTIDCETLETFADTPERWIDVSWGEGPDAPEAHVGRLEITLSNKAGAPLSAQRHRYPAWNAPRGVR